MRCTAGVSLVWGWDQGLSQQGVAPWSMKNIYFGGKRGGVVHFNTNSKVSGETERAIGTQCIRQLSHSGNRAKVEPLYQ